MKDGGFHEFSMIFSQYHEKSHRYIMSCLPCASRDFLPKCAIYAILNRLSCSNCSVRSKARKYEDFKCGIRALSRFSIDPRGGYAAFLGLRSNDVSSFASIYIDNIRGEYDPNIGAHRVYHVAFVQYGDMNAVCRTLQQRASVIAGNSDYFGGESSVEGSVSQKVFRSQPNPNLPIGITMPFAGNIPVIIPGSAEDLAFGNDFGAGENI